MNSRKGDVFHNPRCYMFMHFLYLVIFHKVATHGGRSFGLCFHVFQGRLSAHRASHCHLVVQEVMKSDAVNETNTIEPSFYALSLSIYIYR
jgi:hypothetical protein